MTTQPNPTPATDVAAARFVDEQLTQAQRSLARSRAFSLVCIVVMSCYIGFITVTIKTRLLEPKAAAELATTYATSIVDEQGRALSAHLVEQVPAYLQTLPDVFLAELPSVRMDLEKQLDFVLHAYAQRISTDLGSYLDEFLVAHKDEVVEFLNASQDPRLIEQLGDQIEKEALSYLYLKGQDGQSAWDKLQEGLVVLNALEVKLNRLANAKDLTPQQKSLRQLIGVSLRYTKT